MLLYVAFQEVKKQGYLFARHFDKLMYHEVIHEIEMCRDLDIDVILADNRIMTFYPDGSTRIMYTLFKDMLPYTREELENQLFFDCDDPEYHIEEMVDLPIEEQIEYIFENSAIEASLFSLE